MRHRLENDRIKLIAFKFNDKLQLISLVKTI